MDNKAFKAVIQRTEEGSPLFVFVGIKNVSVLLDKFQPYRKS